MLLPGTVCNALR